MSYIFLWVLIVGDTYSPALSPEVKSETHTPRRYQKRNNQQAVMNSTIVSEVIVMEKVPGEQNRCNWPDLVNFWTILTDKWPYKTEESRLKAGMLTIDDTLPVQGEKSNKPQPRNQSIKFYNALHCTTVTGTRWDTSIKCHNFIKNFPREQRHFRLDKIIIFSCVWISKIKRLYVCRDNTFRSVVNILNLPNPTT